MKTREERKRDVRWWVLALAVYLATGATAMLVAKRNTERMAEEYNQQIAMYSQMAENEREKSRQWEHQYRDALMEISDLKAANEELIHENEEISFALDEVCYETGWTNLGEFRVTHYCDCVKCCGKWAGGHTATGTDPTEGRTVAVDPAVIPLGSEVRLNGHTYIAEDTGVHGKAIDIFVNDHEEALRLGMYYAPVEWRES